LRLLFLSRRVGDRVRLTIIRNGRRKELVMVMKERPG